MKIVIELKLGAEWDNQPANTGEQGTHDSHNPVSPGPPHQLGKNGWENTSHDEPTRSSRTKQIEYHLLAQAFGVYPPQDINRIWE